MLTQMIAERLNTLVGSVASSTLDREVSAVMAHVESQVVFASELFGAQIASESLRDVAHLAMDQKSLRIGQFLVANRTLTRPNLLKVNEIVLVEVILRFENDVLSLALSVAASEGLISDVVKIFVSF